MQVILKAANEGKTTEAIKAAYIAAQHHEVLIVSSEESADSLQTKLDRFAAQNPAFANRYDIVTTESVATPEMFDDVEYFHQFGTIILDVNFAMSRGPWITVCAELEAYGYEVVATQQLIKPVAKQETRRHYH
ncbi:hypothetical protein UGMREWDR_CDS0156 [Aeromonas phage GomatiRiver_11]|nr:hypothetical protein OBDJBBDK_00148 [Aeromonas phage AhFM11]WKW84323.1 hypothetical protein UGMREWDR_CDS0156 [Aeromonas phage GomatiRiver_11]